MREAAQRILRYNAGMDSAGARTQDAISHNLHRLGTVAATMRTF